MALSKARWEFIKKDYEEGVTITELSKRYPISKGAISIKAKNGKWKVKAKPEFSEAAEKTEEVIKEMAPAIYRLNESLEKANDDIKNIKYQLKHAFTNFIRGAFNINMKNLREVSNVTNLAERVILINKMKATIPDLLQFADFQVKNGDFSAALDMSESKDGKQSDRVFIIEPVSKSNS